MVLDIPGTSVISVTAAFLRFVIEPNLFSKSRLRFGPIPFIESIFDKV